MKVDILIPSYRQFNSNAFAAIQAMCNFTKAQGVDLAVPALIGSALVHRSRNKAIASVRPDADFVLFCDDDMVPYPDSLMRLLSLRLPVVSAHTVTRELPPKIAAKMWNEERECFVPFERLREGKIVSGKIGLGTGFLLLNREVLDVALDWHLRGMDWLCENRRRLDRLRVRTEQREAERERLEGIRRQNYAADHAQHRLFHYCVQGNEIEMGEDTSFSWKLIHMGVETAVDTTVQVGHVGDMPFCPAMLDVDDPMDLIGSAMRPDYSAIIQPMPKMVV